MKKIKLEDIETMRKLWNLIKRTYKKIKEYFKKRKKNEK